MAGEDMHDILLHSIPNGLYKQYYINGFGFESENFKSADIMFEKWISLKIYIMGSLIYLIKNQQWNMTTVMKTAGKIE